MNADLAGVPARDAQRLAAVPLLASASEVRALAGGITNRNYRVELPDGPAVVRLSDPESSELAIDRENEYLNSVAAAASGAAPAVLDYVRGAGVLVVQWVEGRTFAEDDVRNASNLPRIAEACRVLHAGPAFANRFDMFDIQRRYRRLVGERGFRLPARYDEFAAHAARIEEAFASSPEPIVPCNNDLLAANMIDDGQRLWLIDYEYSGNNEASFELGNIWSESTLPPELLEILVAAYWGAASAARVARARLWALMSKYGWTLWASIQEGISVIDFDYWSWGMEKYDRAVEEFDSPDFERWLAAAAS